MPTSGTPSTTTTERVIKKIRASSFRGFIAWPGSDDGHLNTVFIASFEHPTLGAVDAYVKLYPYDNGTNRGLIHEITGYLYAHALGVPQPPAAFLADIPLNLLQDLESRLTSGHWLLEAKAKLATWPGFCTIRLDGKSAAVHAPSTDGTLLRDDIAAWEALPKTVALDENIAHVDRHYNNLIRLGRRNYAVIDNGRLVNGTGETWSRDMLLSHHLYRNRLSEHVWGHAPSDTLISEMIDFARHHYGKFKTIAAELDYWMTLLLPHDRDAFRQFLTDRTEQTEWLLRKRYSRLL